MALVADGEPTGTTKLSMINTAASQRSDRLPADMIMIAVVRLLVDCPLLGFPVHAMLITMMAGTCAMTHNDDGRDEDSVLL